MVQKSCKPVEVGSLSHSLQGFSTIQTVVGLGISEASLVGRRSLEKTELPSIQLSFQTSTKTHVWNQGNQGEKDTLPQTTLQKSNIDTKNLAKL